MASLKVLALVHPSCVPPKGATIKDADWADWKTEFYVKRSLKRLGHEVVFYGVSDELSEVEQRIRDEDPDIVFNLLEEFQGEPSFEAHVVSFLELLGIPYTGCNPQGLSLGRDKSLAKKVLQFHNIPTPGFFVVKRGKSFKAPKDLRFPMIVKSLVEEASLGISQDSVVTNPGQLKKRVQFIHEKIETDALIEEYVPGRELYVGVLGNDAVKVLEPWELDFGDLASGGANPIATRNVKFNAKYVSRHGIRRGLAKNISPFVLRSLRTLSKEAYKALKLNGYARIDWRLTAEGELFLLEVNPNAELADKECLANAARHSGLDYDALISKILRLGLSYGQAS